MREMIGVVIGPLDKTHSGGEMWKRCNEIVKEFRKRAGWVVKGAVSQVWRREEMVEVESKK